MSKKKLAIIGWANSIHTERWANFYASSGNWQVVLITNTEFRGDKYQDSIKICTLTPKLTCLRKVYQNIKHLLGRTDLRKKEANSFNIDTRRGNQEYFTRIFTLGLLVIHGWQIFNIIRNERVDIINVQSLSGFSTPMFFAMLFMKLLHFERKPPIVCNAWGYSKRLWWEKWIEEYVVEEATCIQTTSYKTANIYRDRYSVEPSKIEVFSWGIDLKIFKIGYAKEVQNLRREIGLNQQDKIVFHNRHLHPLYNVEKVIEIIAKVIPANPNIKFLFIRGNMYSPEYEKHLYNLVKSLGVESHVIFLLRYVSPREMAILLNASFATISKPTSYDQLASSILESMACGAIPIISDYEGYKPWLQGGKNVFFIAGGREAEYAEKILYLANDETLRNEMRENNIKLAREIADSEKGLQKMEGILRKALE